MIRPAAGAVPLYEPKLCYILDGFLMLYGIMITALFIREKCFQPKTSQGPNDTYQGLQRRTDDKYEEIKRRGDVESGSNRGRRQDDDTYTRLNRPSEDTYKEIQTKDRRRKDDQVYQGLNTGTKDTYDRLHAQPRQPR